MRESPLIERLAEAVSDGDPIDWQRARVLADTPHERTLVEQLQAFAAEVALPSTAGVYDVPRTPWYAVVSRAWSVAVMLLAAAGVVLVPARLSASHMAPAQALLVLAFGGAAAWLALGGRTDRRTRPLMDVYLLCGAAIAHALVPQRSAGQAPGVLLGLGLEAWLPVFMWRFAQAFPRVVRFTPLDRLADAMGRVSLLVGCGLIGLQIASMAGALGPDSMLARFTRQHPSGRFWDVVYPLLLAGFVAIVLRARHAPVHERQRVVWFAIALLAGILPLIVVGTLQALWPAFAAFTDSRHAGRFVIDAVVLCGLAGIPLSTAYAVLVQRVFSLPVVIGRAARYALARTSVSAMGVCGLLLLGLAVFRNRDRTLAEIAASPSGALALGVVGLAAAALVLREPLLALVDRMFLGRRGNDRALLVESTERLREARGRRAVAGRLVDEARHAFGTDAGALLVPGLSAWGALHGVAPELGAESALIRLAVAEGGPIDVRPAGELFRLLPAADREWLTRARCELLVPVAGSDGRLLALLSLGAKAGELPFTRDDRLVLATLATTASIAFDTQAGIAASAESAETGDAATECAACGLLDEPTAVICRCGGVLRPALLPCLLAGKFQVERVLGRGGMGVVYGGRDRDLQRRVALKTLPRMSAEDVDRIRAEAQAMAAVSHPNLAVIFSIERWVDRPVLVVEHLEGGTLAERIRSHPLAIAEALRMGIDLAGAVAALHHGGILHRDIKPSNIGFARGGAPKLLDFGIARLVIDAAGEPGAHAVSADLLSTRSAAVAGTPAYLSPEALAGAPPDVGFDLWALALVLFEAIAGTNPFAAGSVEDVRGRIQRIGSPDLARWRPGALPELRVLFASWLAPDAAERPRSGEQLRAQLTDAVALLRA